MLAEKNNTIFNLRMINGEKSFFSFHYDDVVSFRANVVRNHGFFKGNEAAGFGDNSMGRGKTNQ